jgi:hypothetical protein
MITGTSPVSLVDSSGESCGRFSRRSRRRSSFASTGGKDHSSFRGLEAKFKGFFDGEAFSRALPPGPAPEDFLRELRPENGVGFVGSFAHTRYPAIQRLSRQLEQAVPLFGAGGATLCVSQVETRVPSLVPFIAAIKRQLPPGFATRRLRSDSIETSFPTSASMNSAVVPADNGPIAIWR